ncbi:hypothetical protein [Streptomyces europaeiscabiei]|uniref:Uncharacterized protein n=1 Tax=Streptomyces europaeiscabiei TaxID=146819 RepID=A0ABU4NRB5_9ACTN|nr:hypothetical protein [Streptomyces europaeiscabiei]MDX2526180.1 hypothetical protein [Streptomyces europaeiscabiei]MDX2760983.1 hypothetical protein [Streptomyces europaeiscabiei]MDX2769070.1 hypothetical protein [Streptomyces europaeiscabiei]MDX3547558.1 hypothetical protein [Streptomyces europaeiscabiei]MDX3557035.1 hypothetical protein [Streptomyces europaeiscabiei]
MSVEYRPAPDHPDPAPVEDCYAGAARHRPLRRAHRASASRRRASPSSTAGARATTRSCSARR